MKKRAYFTEVKELYFIIDRIPEEALETAKNLIEDLVASLEKHNLERKMTEEEFQVYLDSAPEEDEELSEEELQGIEEGRKAIQEDRVVPFEEVVGELGI